MSNENEKMIPARSIHHVAIIAPPSEAGALLECIRPLAKGSPSSNPLYTKVDIENLTQINASGSNVATINLIHDAIDPFMEATPSLRICDGALVVVDCMEGLGAKVEVALHKALSERIRPVLLITGIDDLMQVSLKIGPEKLYAGCQAVIEHVNDVIAAYDDPQASGFQVHAEDGSVAFGSLRHGWAFTVPQFAHQYAKRFGADCDMLCLRLWGDSYFDRINKRWTQEETTDNDAKPLKRAACEYIFEPLLRLRSAAAAGDTSAVHKMHTALRADMPALELTSPVPELASLTGEALLKGAFASSLPASEVILRMIVQHVPSPAQAQAHRAEVLVSDPDRESSGVHGQALLDAVSRCDSQSSPVVFISRVVPATEASDGHSLIAFGRVFAGSICAGQRVRIQTGDPKSVAIKPVVSCGSITFHGEYSAAPPDVVIPAGQLCVLQGLGSYILNCATLTSGDIEVGEVKPGRPQAEISIARYSTTSPTVYVVVEPANVADLPKLMQALKHLHQTEAGVVCTISPLGEYTVSAASEHQLRACLVRLEADLKGMALKISELLVSYQEGVTCESDRLCVAKSPNKHNRVYCRARPLSDSIVGMLESGAVDADDEAARVSVLVACGWEEAAAKKVWCFGPSGCRGNALVDVTKGVQFLNELKDPVQSGFQRAVSQGVLCEEPLRAVQINFEDVVYYADAIHRGGSQLIPATRRAIMASCLTAKPCLLEPWTSVEILGLTSCQVESIWSTVQDLRGVVDSECANEHSSHVKLRARLPLAESTRLCDALAAMGLKNSPTFLTSSWQAIQADPLNPVSIAGMVVQAVRARKGLSMGVPPLETYYDKF